LGGAKYTQAAYLASYNSLKPDAFSQRDLGSPPDKREDLFVHPESLFSLGDCFIGAKATPKKHPGFRCQTSVPLQETEWGAIWVGAEKADSEP
jgi:hypothetical protein